MKIIKSKNFYLKGYNAHKKCIQVKIETKMRLFITSENTKIAVFILLHKLI